MTIPPWECTSQERKDPHSKTLLWGRCQTDTFQNAGPCPALEVAITSRSSSRSPAWPRRLGIYAPLRQAGLMDGFQDGSRVSGIHLPDVSTFSFKSSLMLAAVRSLSWASPSAGLPAGKDLQGRSLQGPEDRPPQPLPQTPALPRLDKPSREVI